MSPHSAWLLVNEIVPRLKSAVPHAVRAVGCEDAEELIQDATVMAAKMLHNVEAAGKSVTAGNIAYYTIQHMKSGRRSTGSSSVDVLHAGTQLNGRSEMISLDEPVMSDESDECLTLHDVLSSDCDDPGAMACRKMDWEAFCKPLSATRKAVLVGMAQGKTLREVGRQRGVSETTTHHHRARLEVTIREFMGDNILKDLAQTPQWKIGLIASRQRSAMRAQRSSK